MVESWHLGKQAFWPFSALISSMVIDYLSERLVWLAPPLSHFQWLLLGSSPRMFLHFSVSSCPSLNIQDQIHPKGPLERGRFHICETVLLGLLWNLLKDEAKQPDRAMR